MKPFRMTEFEKKTSDHIEVEMNESPTGQIPVYSIHSFHSLTQFIGFGKYLYRDKGNVYLRGQTSLYDGSLTLSLLRDVNKKSPNFSKRVGDAKEHIKQSTDKMKKFCDNGLVEPLLQHYGIKTHWLDIVDNTWIALWFALHKTRCIIADNREYIHIYESESDEYAYLFLIGCDAQTEKSPGFFSGESTSVVDLRKAVRSTFLRPHAQHALMLKKTGIFLEYSDRVVAIAKIKVSDGLRWIGQTDLLSVQSLFPPPYYDSGFAQFLNEYETPKNDKNFIKHYGSIQNISY